MPQLFKVGSFRIYFWVNEGVPLEPVHVHIAEGEPQKDATKVWITQTGKCIVANNKSAISKSMLRQLIQVIEANSAVIIERWTDLFDEIDYYC